MPKMLHSSQMTRARDIAACHINLSDSEQDARISGVIAGGILPAAPGCKSPYTLKTWLVRACVFRSLRQCARNRRSSETVSIRFHGFFWMFY